MTRTMLTICGFLAILGVNMGGCDITITPIETTADDAVDLSPADVAAVGTLKVEWVNGTIDVQVDAAATELSINADRKVSGFSSISAEDALADWEIKVNVDNANPPNVTLKFNKPSNSLMYRANLTIVVPATAGIVIESDNGEVQIDGNQAATKVTLDNGEVTVVNQKGKSTIKTDNGEVTVESLEGDVDVQTANGRVTIDAAAGDVVVVTDNGEVDIEAAGGNVDVETDNGEIDIVAQPLENDSVEARSSFGRITIRVPADFGADLKLETEFGSVDADLTAFDTANVSTSLRKVTAELNGGGGTILGRADFGGVDFDNIP
jgi:hypothetical protein